MSSQRDEVRNWFFEALAVRLSSVYEMMTGERPAVQWEPIPTAPAETGLCWRQEFEGGAIRDRSAVWITATDANWGDASKQVLLAADIHDPDDETARSTYFETLGQVLSGVAQDMGGRLGYEVSCKTGGESAEAIGESRWGRLKMRFESGPVELIAGIEQDLLDALTAPVPPPPTEKAIAAPSVPASPGNSKTFELLLDVELPVSISFGRAQIPLKDVLKLTTGSIVELNRSIAEPVEVIVNNCVIARGEVVVVEGNFGVRIHEVISRQERLRTLS